jgi:hypothetical protein
MASQKGAYGRAKAPDYGESFRSGVQTQSATSYN